MFPQKALNLQYGMYKYSFATANMLQHKKLVGNQTGTRHAYTEVALILNSAIVLQFVNVSSRK